MVDDVLIMFVYALIDTRTNWILYVGKTIGRLSDRLASHLSNAYNNRPGLLPLYINDTSDGWKYINILEIDTGRSDKELRTKELWWIRELEPPFNIAGQHKHKSKFIPHPLLLKD